MKLFDNSYPFWRFLCILGDVFPPDLLLDSPLQFVFSTPPTYLEGEPHICLVFHKIYSCLWSFIWYTRALIWRFRAVERSKNWEEGGIALCVDRTFLKKQDLTVKLKSELICIKFQYFSNVLANPKPISLTQTIPSMCEP